MNKKLIYYKYEIDGLRAFAVIAVIINHFNKEILPSGYLGVDIFFIISGYVITSSLKNKASSSFAEFLISFYERRIKRLIPALIFFVVVTSILICLFRDDSYNSVKTGISSLFGLSNFALFWASKDYFASSTALNPFSHTWSLGVEEQFYFIFPFLVWCTGFGRHTLKGTRNLFLTLLFLIIFSLISFIFFYPINQNAAYYLMPFRFWEIASGSILFLFIDKKTKILEKIRNLPSFLYFIVLLGLMFLPIKAGIIATITTIIFTFLLISSIKKDKLIYQILTIKGIQRIGLLSYSLYLWHWGIISLSLWTIGIHWWSIPFQVLLIYFFANISYKYIETPLRQKNWSLQSWQTLTKGIFTLIITSISIFLSYKSFGKKIYLGYKNFSLNNSVDYIGKFTGRKAKNCFTTDEFKKDALKGKLFLTSNYLNDCYFKSSNKSMLFSFLGDSHTLSIFPISENLIKEYKINTFVLSRGSCAYPTPRKTTRRGCYEVMQSANEFVINELDNKIGGVIIASSYLNSYFSEFGDAKHQFNNNENILENFYSQIAAPNKNLKEYILSLDELSENLKKKNSSLVILAPLPNHPLFRREICSKQPFRPDFINAKNCQKTSRLYLEQERKNVLKMLKELEKVKDNIFIYDAFDEFCDSNYCYTSKNGIDFYFDDNHLSDKGVDYIYQSFINFLDSNKLLPIKIENID